MISKARTKRGSIQRVGLSLFVISPLCSTAFLLCMFKILIYTLTSWSINHNLKESDMLSSGPFCVSRPAPGRQWQFFIIFCCAMFQAQISKPSAASLNKGVFTRIRPHYCLQDILEKYQFTAIKRRIDHGSSMHKVFCFALLPVCCVMYTCSSS